MDNPNINMDEYIRLEEEKARKRGKVFNWENAKYGKIWYDEDIHNLRSVETEFPAIVFNDELSSKKHFLVNPQFSYGISIYEYAICNLRTEGLKIYNLCINLVNFTDMAPLPPREQRHSFLRYQGLEYSDQDISDFKERLKRIHNRDTHRVQVLDFEGMPELMRDVLYATMLMEHRNNGGVMVFTSRAWGRVFETRGPLVRELILEFLSRLRFGEVLLDLDTLGTIQFQLGGAKRRPARQEVNAGGVTKEAPMALRGSDEDEEMPHAREVLDIMARDFSRFTMWTVTSLAQMMDRADVTYTSYSKLPVEYQRRIVRQRTDGASTSIAQQDE
ncbi:hypothetical protein Tco_1194437 [Tanacetum coccineum]